MPNITLTNLSARNVFINFLYRNIQAGQSLTVYRSASDLMAESRLHELVQNGTLSLDIDYTEEERESYFDIFPGFSLPEGEAGTLLPTHRRYVDINAPGDGDGSVLNPYQTIQAAVDDLELLTLDTTKESAVVYIQPGKYEEAVVIHKPSITLVSTTFTAHSNMRTCVWLEPSSDQWPLTFTNATPESLAAYDISGNYGDLVNQGDAGPQRNRVIGIYFLRNSDDTGLVRCLGVQGDYSPTETEFGLWIVFEHCRLFLTGGAYPYALYGKNCGDLLFSYCSCARKGHRLENSYRQYYYNSDAPVVHISYDESDPYGKNRLGHYAMLFLENSTLRGADEDSLISHSGTSGGAYLIAMNSYLGLWAYSSTYKLTIEGDDGYAWLHSAASLMDLTLGANIDLYARDFRTVGDVELQSGPGTADWEGAGGWVGELTDPDNKLVQNPYKRIAYPAIVTSAITATPSQRIRYDTSGGTFQIDAPASPNTGDSFAVKEYASDVTNVTVSGNGNNIEHPTTGVRASSAVFGVASISVTWEYDGTNWIVV